MADPDWSDIGHMVERYLLYVIRIVLEETVYHISYPYCTSKFNIYRGRAIVPRLDGGGPDAHASSLQIRPLRRSSWIVRSCSFHGRRTKEDFCATAAFVPPSLSPNDRPVRHLHSVRFIWDSIHISIDDNQGRMK